LAFYDPSFRNADISHATNVTDNNLVTKVDPIRQKYYLPLERAELLSTAVFYVAAFLSVAVVLISKDDWPKSYQVMQITFLTLTVTSFVLGVAIRLYWAPRAQGRRLEDFLSNSLDTHLTHERTTGYYNNDETEPFIKMAFQLLENTYFSKELFLSACNSVRVQCTIYVLVWLIAIANRSTPIDLVVAISQALFAEQLLSRYFRTEYIRASFEKSHDEVYKLLQSKITDRMFEASVLTHLVNYETAKANTCVFVSPKTFERKNAQLSKDWEGIRATIVVRQR
jgi:hypothetical protein